MLPEINRRFTLKTRPRDLPGPAHFQLDETAHPALASGEVRVRSLYHALSPWQGQRMKDFKNFVLPVAKVITKLAALRQLLDLSTKQRSIQISQLQAWRALYLF